MIGKSKGITVIALVITIIILLILAGVTIVTLTGENGILTKANNAKEETIISTEKEQISTAQIATVANRLGEDWNVGDLQDELDNLVGAEKTKVTYNADDSINVWFSDTKHNYHLKDNQIIRIEDSDMIFGDESWYEYQDVEGGVKITGVTEEVGKYTPLGILLTISMENPELIERLESSDEEVKAQAQQELEELYNIKQEEGKIYRNVGNIPSQINGKDVVEIGSNAFSSFLYLEYIDIPNTVKKIGRDAFSKNEILNLEIPASVTLIEGDAFSGNNLKYVKFNGKCPEIELEPDFEKGIFNANDGLISRRIKVPEGEKINYDKQSLYYLGISSYDVIYE